MNQKQNFTLERVENIVKKSTLSIFCAQTFSNPFPNDKFKTLTD